MNNAESITHSLYGGRINLRFNPNTHYYHVAQVTDCVPQFQGELNTFHYVPSVTTVLKIVGGDKINGLMYWAVNCALEHLDGALIDKLALPAAEQILDQLEEYLRAKSGVGQQQVSIADLYGWMNTLQISVDNAPWASLRAEAKKAHTLKRDAAGDLGTHVHSWIETCIRHLAHGFALPEIPPALPKKSREALQRWVDEVNGQTREYLAVERPVYSISGHFCGTLDALYRQGDVYTVDDVKTSKKVYPEHFLQLSAYAWALMEEGIIPEGSKVVRCVTHVDKEKGTTKRVVADGDLEQDASAFLAARHLHKHLKDS